MDALNFKKRYSPKQTTTATSADKAKCAESSLKLGLLYQILFWKLFWVKLLNGTKRFSLQIMER